MLWWCFVLCGVVHAVCLTSVSQVSAHTRQDLHYKILTWNKKNEKFLHVKCWMSENLENQKTNSIVSMNAKPEWLTERAWKDSGTYIGTNTRIHLCTQVMNDRNDPWMLKQYRLRVHYNNVFCHICVWDVQQSEIDRYASIRGISQLMISEVCAKLLNQTGTVNHHFCSVIKLTDRVFLCSTACAPWCFSMAGVWQHQQH